MYWTDHLKIPKKLKQLTVWIHSEGRVDASLFLDLQDNHSTEEEELLNTFDQAAPFLALKRQDSGELSFYNKAFIIRAEYHEENPPEAVGITPLPCRLHLIDGSVMKGSVREPLRPESSRLSDYLNLSGRSFTRIYLEDRNVCLINKAYIVSVVPLGDSSCVDPDRRCSLGEIIPDLA